LQSTDFLGKKRVIKKSWGYHSGRMSRNYSEQEEHKIKPHLLRNLPKHKCVFVHSEQGHRKRLLPPLEANGSGTSMVSGFSPSRLFCGFRCPPVKFGFRMNTDETGGTSGYRGYEYQILVTVWLALKLMVEKQACGEIEVEPASHEDIAAKLDVPPNSATGVIGLTTAEVQLDVQVKSRDSGQWTESEFLKVLEPPPRQPAGDSTATTKQRRQAGRLRPLARLREIPARHYLFMTNAQLHPRLRDFAVKTIGIRSVARRLPVAKQPVDAEALAPRVGVLAQLTNEHLALEIGDLLRRGGHVQPSQVKSCIADLHSVVRQRLLKEVDGIWKRAEIEAILRKYGGLPTPPRGLVPPSNMSEIQARLKTGRLILTGSSGTGKTFVAEHLEHEHRTADEPYDIITADAGIGQIRSFLDQPGRHLFVFHDPWGHYQLESNADFWRSELPKLFRQASPAKRFLVTSRTGIKAQAFGEANPAGFNDAEVTITPEKYPMEARKRILALYMRDAPAWQRDLVQREEERICRELGAPLSLQEFAEALRRETHEGKVKIEELIRRSNVEVISRTCADEIKSLGAESAAAGVALWSLFVTRSAVSEEMARTLREQLKAGGYLGNIDPVKLFRWLEKAGRLVPVTDGFSVHPTIMQGLEMLIDDEPAQAEEVLSAQLRSFAVGGEGAQLETLAKYIATRSLRIPVRAQAVLNEHLRTQVLALDGSAWQQAFRALTKFSTGTDAVTVLAKALRPRERAEMQGFEHWQPPLLSSAEVASITAEPETQQVAVKFIRHLLANDQMFHCEAKEFVDFFAQFGWDLSGEFFAIVKQALEDERPLAMDLFVEAALLTKEPRFDELINEALSATDAIDKWYLSVKEEIRQAAQCETDVAHANHVDEEPGDRYWPVQTALKTGVRVRRGREGYDWLVAHPRRNDLLSSWAESLPQGASDAELTALRNICKPCDERPFWKAVEKANSKDLAGTVANGLDSAPEEHLDACLETLAALVNVEEWQAFFAARAGGLTLRRRLAQAAATFHGNSADEKQKLLRSALFGAEQLRALDLCLDGTDDSEGASHSPEALSSAARAFLDEIARHGPDRLAVEALRVLGSPAELASEQLPRLLSSPSMHTRHNALLLAAKAKEFDGRGALRHALEDKDYHCRRLALRLLAEGASPEERQRILMMAKDASAPVRLACAEIIATHRWPEGESVLAQLIYDTRDASDGGGFRFSMPNYHVARAAAIALRELSPLSPDAVREIIACIENYRPSEKRYRMPDIGLPYQLLFTLAYESHAEILDLYLRRLHDDWYVEGMEQSGYPLRFAAAWGLVIQLSQTPALRTQINPAVLLEGASHSDDRLAGPCLMALGMLGNRAYEQLVTLAANSQFTRECALIVATALPKAATAARDAIAGVLPPDSPQQRFLTWASQNATASAEVAEQFLSEDSEVAAWLVRIQKRDGIFPELRCALHQRFAAPFGAKLQYNDLLLRHLPKSIPVLTMRSMFGGE
jgi:hypothetical protein